MIDLAKEDRSRQDSVLVEGVEYKIKTEFFHWLSFAKKFEDWQKEGRETFSYDEFDYLYEWGAPENREAGYEGLREFYRNEQPLPNPSGKGGNVRGLDWQADSEYVYCAFLQQYGIDLIKTTGLHWHGFLALFNGLTGTKLNDIMSARYSDDKKGVMREMREAWELPELEAERPIFEMV
jgi:hypothetical protein